MNPMCSIKAIFFAWTRRLLDRGRKRQSVGCQSGTEDRIKLSAHQKLFYTFWSPLGSVNAAGNRSTTVHTQRESCNQSSPQAVNRPNCHCMFGEVAVSLQPPHHLYRGHSQVGGV